MNELLIFLIIFLAGGIVGFVICNLTLGRKKAGAQQQELDQTKAELEQYKSQVNSHFTTSAELMEQVASSYQDLYSHMAGQSQTLLSDKDVAPFPLLKTPEHKKWEDPTQAEKTDEDTVPLDNREHLPDSNETVLENSETVLDSNETVSENREAVVEKSEIVSDSNETVSENRETVVENSETVSDSNGTVSENRETVVENSETISDSNGTVSESRESIPDNVEPGSDSSETVPSKQPHSNRGQT